MKTHDEIKKGLVEAIEEASWVVEGGDAHDLIDAVELAHVSMADALALIQQLERERDAAVEELKKFNCASCIHEELQADEEPCARCNRNWICEISKDLRKSHWQWRGVQEVEH